MWDVFEGRTARLGRRTHLSVATAHAHDKHYGVYDAADLQGWVRCVIDAGDLYCELGERGWVSRRQRAACRDIAFHYGLNPVIDRR